MPLQIAEGEHYIEVDRFFLDSDDKEEGGTVSDYRVKLNKVVEDVIGIELTAYAVPSSLTPTFLSGTNDTVDFSLSAGALTKTFTARWPSQSYTYQNVDNPYLSYVNGLAQILGAAVAFDPDFGLNGPNFAFFFSVADVGLKTDIRVSGTGITEFRLLFASGPNAAEAANVQMGFPTAVDTAAGVTEIVSPQAVKLDIYTRVDITVDEFAELRPLDVVYNTNSAYFGTIYNDKNVTRTQLLTQPLRRLEFMTIRLRINGVPVVDTPRNAHSLTFTVFSLSKDIALPKWAKLQKLAL